MHPVIAHLGHWYESALFAVPMVVIAAVLWRSAHREKLASEHGEAEWDGHDEWKDPRLSDSDEDSF